MPSPIIERNDIMRRHPVIHSFGPEDFDTWDEYLEALHTCDCDDCHADEMTADLIDRLREG